MAFGFKNIGHFFASVAGDIVKGARAVGKAEVEVEAISSLFFPQAVALERGAFALLGMAAQAVKETGDAAAANGINIVLDQQLIADIKLLIEAIEQYAKTAGLTKPAGNNRFLNLAKGAAESTRARCPLIGISVRDVTSSRRLRSSLPAFSSPGPGTGRRQLRR